jgi:hypothetical protein
VSLGEECEEGARKKRKGGTGTGRVGKTKEGGAHLLFNIDGPVLVLVGL